MLEVDGRFSDFNAILILNFDFVDQVKGGDFITLLLSATTTIVE